jgi:sodium-coupled neutral amino acid transporter 7/8
MIPVICFSYQGHISAVPLYAELQYRSTARWLKVICLGLMACVILYNATGLLGFLSFLSGTESDILKSFLEHTDALNIPIGFMTTAIAAVAMAVSVTCAVFTFCARSAVLDELARLCGWSAAVLAESPLVFYGVTYIWMMAVAVCAVRVPDIGKVVSVVGNFSAFFMFQFPGCCLLSAANSKDAEDRDGAGPVTAKRAISLRVVTAGQNFGSRSSTLRILGWMFNVIGTVVFILGMCSAFFP